MAYSVKEIFYSLQGEGTNVGRPSVFVRFAGCNLWNGKAEDRANGKGSCSAWCDTDFVGVDGIRGGVYQSCHALVSEVLRIWPAHAVHPFVVCTGGEPLLQLDEALIAAFHAANCEVALETNGTKQRSEERRVGKECR